MTPLFTDYPDHLLISTRKALKDSIARRGWLVEMKAQMSANLRQLELVMEGRKVRA